MCQPHSPLLSVSDWSVKGVECMRQRRQGWWNGRVEKGEEKRRRQRHRAERDRERGGAATAEHKFNYQISILRTTTTAILFIYTRIQYPFIPFMLFISTRAPCVVTSWLLQVLRCAWGSHSAPPAPCRHQQRLMRPRRTHLQSSRDPHDSHDHHDSHLCVVRQRGR